MATKQRNIRVDDKTWEAATRRAKDEGITVSGLVREFLVQYSEDSVANELSRVTISLERLRERLTG